MAIYVNRGRAVLAELVLSRPLHLAIGTGDWADGEVPPPDHEATGLRNEIGRKALLRGIFVYPDDEGPFELPGDRHYSASETPTRHLHLTFQFGYNEGVNTEVREIGIFVGTKIKPNLPANRRFFIPGDLDDPGQLLFLEYLPEAGRFNPQIKGGYETVLSF